MLPHALTLSLCVLILIVVPCAAVRAAGGRIVGGVSDPKGAAVVGATVTVSEPGTDQVLTAVTDEQGRYVINGLAPGSYVVTVSADGFAEARRRNVEVREGGETTVDVRVQVAALNATTVTVPANGAKANANPTYQQIRQQAREATNFDSGCVSVNNLVLRRDAATFTFKSGEVCFAPPVGERTIGGVFVGEGEFQLTPPVQAASERRSLAQFVDSPTLTEQFSQLVMRFTDATADEIRKSPAVRERESGSQAARAREIYRANQDYLRRELHTNIELRTLVDLLSTSRRPGFFDAFIQGRRFSKLAYIVDPLGVSLVAPEQVLLASFDSENFGLWASFYTAEDYKRGTAISSADRRLIDIERHEMDVTIRGTRIVATDAITFRSLTTGGRVVPFGLNPILRVRRVQDETGADLDFIQEDKNQDGDFGVILREPLRAGKVIKIVVQYDGEGALDDYGGGNFALVERSNWYPANGDGQFGDRARFDMTFRYPKGYTFVGTGAPLGAETRDGDMTVAKWSSGDADLKVAGFNYGKFKRRELAKAESGYGVEFFANTQIAPELRDMQRQIQMAEMQTGMRVEELTDGGITSGGSGSTTGAADAALAEAENSMRIYNAFFGRLPFSRVAMTQQPFGFFGQSWPTLVYMPYTAFLSPTERRNFMGARGAVDTFWQYVGPHEVAHQWWGHTIGWGSYRDQWMSEGFSEFSASLYVQFVRRDMTKFVDFWEELREQIVTATPATKGKRPYTAGAVTQGFRLNNAKTGGAYRYLVYPKGAYILHMLRMMMYDQRSGAGGGDARFQAMMRDFVQTYFNRDVTTEDFKRIVDKHTVPEADLDGNKRMDWFFDQWVYGTEVPSYDFEYAIDGKTLSGTITQSGVSDKFKMRVPVYVDYGKGWQRLGSATVVGNASVPLTNLQLPQTPKRVAVCVLNDVLAVEIKNRKR